MLTNKDTDEIKELSSDLNKENEDQFEVYIDL